MSSVESTDADCRSCREGLDDEIAGWHDAWEFAKTIGSPRGRARSCRALAERYLTIGNGDLAERFQQLAIRAGLEAETEELAIPPTASQHSRKLSRQTIEVHRN